MWTTKKLLRALQKKLISEYGKATIYRTAKVLDVSRQAVTKWDNGASINDENAIKIAVLLNLDTEYVLACLHAERAKGSEAYPFLCNLAKRSEAALAA